MLKVFGKTLFRPHRVVHELPLTDNFAAGEHKKEPTLDTMDNIKMAAREDKLLPTEKYEKDV